MLVLIVIMYFSSICNISFGIILNIWVKKRRKFYRMYSILEKLDIVWDEFIKEITEENIKLFDSKEKVVIKSVKEQKNITVSKVVLEVVNIISIVIIVFGCVCFGGSVFFNVLYY